MWIQELYVLNKILDEEFVKRYGANEDKMINKNILSLLVEIGELANETRCFKYWSTKPKSSDEVILEELADVLILTLTLANYIGVENKEMDYINSDLKYRTVDEQFINLYRMVGRLQDDYTKDIILHILGLILTLGFSLGYTETQIKEACLKKMDIIKLRLNSNY